MWPHPADLGDGTCLSGSSDLCVSRPRSCLSAACTALAFLSLSCKKVKQTRKLHQPCYFCHGANNKYCTSGMGKTQTLADTCEPLRAARLKRRQGGQLGALLSHPAWWQNVRYAHPSGGAAERDDGHRSSALPRGGAGDAAGRRGVRSADGRRAGSCRLRQQRARRARLPPHRMCPPPLHPPVKCPLARDGAPEAELLKCGSCRLEAQAAACPRSTERAARKG